jgi:hypothetical protein
MDNIIETIIAAIASDATPEARAAGVQACRAVVAALDPSGEAAPRVERPATPAAAPQQLPVAAIAAALRGQSPDMLIDLAIAKLRSLVPADAQATAMVPKINIPFVPVRKS